jgi:hypothetical protein
MNSNRAERQTDDVQAIKGGLMLPNIQTPDFSVWDESIRFQHNLKVLVRFPKSHSLQALVVKFILPKSDSLKKNSPLLPQKDASRRQAVITKRSHENKMNWAVIWHYYIFLQEGSWRVHKQKYLSRRSTHTNQQCRLV